MVLSLVSVSVYTMFGRVEQMSFYGFADGACHHTLNLASVAWVLYSLADDLVSSRAVCIGPATNSVTKYRVVI